MQDAIESQWQKGYEDHIGEPRAKKKRRVRYEPEDGEPQDYATRCLEWGGVEPPEQTQ